MDSGYKIYMKLHVRNVSRTDFMEYRSAACHVHCKNYSKTLYKVIKLISVNENTVK